MSKFKVGDWVKHTYTMYVGNNNFKVKTKLLQISIAEHDVIKCTNGSEFIIARDSIELWTPQPGEWCWYGYEIVQVIDNSSKLLKICRQDSDCYEELSYNELEPFIGELPTFLKDK